MDQNIEKIETILRSRPKFLKGLTIGALILILIVGGFLLWLWLHFFLGDDLILDLSVNQTSFHVSNVEPANVRAIVTTKGQLFCTTACSLTLLNVSNNQPGFEQSMLLTSRQSIVHDFTLKPGGVGEGQSIYSVSASCHNVKSFLCPTLAPERRKTILITVNYGLQEQEAIDKPRLEHALNDMLTTLRESDILLGQIQGILAQNPRLHASVILPDTTLLENEFAEQELFINKAELLWTEQTYSVLDNLVKNVTFDANKTRDDIIGLKGLLLSLAVDDENDRLALLDQRLVLNAILVRYAAIARDSKNLAEPAVNLSNNLTAAYADSTFSDYPWLENQIVALQDSVRVLNASLAVREQFVLTLGATVAQAQSAELCSRNVTCSANIDSSSVTSICDGVFALSLIDNSSSAEKNTSAQFLSQHCVVGAWPTLDLSELSGLMIVVPNATSSLPVALPENFPQCCVFDSCGQCCNTASCEDDPSTFPVIFVHGHAFNGANSPEYSLGSYFWRIQERLQEDGYVDAGIVTPSNTLSEVGPGEWGLSGRPVTARVTYYYNFYRSGAEYVLIPQKSENIETYALRLKEMIDLIKHHTGKKKVDIVAHSMGGLVVREYIALFGAGSIDKVIFVATPNHGLSGSSQTLCPIFGTSKECADMDASSVFLHKLNDPASQPNITMITITGRGCDVGGQDGDGVVAAASVGLDGVRNYDINGTCTGFLGADLHTDILDIDKYPQVYEIIKQELK